MNDIPDGYFRADNGMLKIAKGATPAKVVDDMNDDELRALTRKKLIGLLESDDTKGGTLLAVCREVLDRIDGKPIARTEASLDVRQVTLEVKALVAQDELIDKLLKLSGPND